ncbi:unnamed protein product [Musa acuminata var. zebrina]
MAGGEGNGGRVAERWREIDGCDDWAGLLDPMDPPLRSELVRYGELAQACYDAFDYDPFSRFCGSCKYNRREFFASLGMKGVVYEVTRYLQHQPAQLLLTRSRGGGAMTWCEKANWIGYVAVPKVPGILFNERLPELVKRPAEGLPWSCSHVGVELALDHKHSPFLKDTVDPSCFHNLEAHLHLLDGPTDGF